MTSGTFKAFVSSTFEDLKNHRAYVIRYLRKAGISVDPMEDWTAESDEPKKFSRDRLAGCDFCVLLVALRRGYVPRGETRSITQLEYQAALDAGIDVLVYLLDADCPWPHRFVELDKDPGISEWRDSLAERHGRGLFSLEPSTIEIAPAVTRWVDKQSRKATKVGDDWIQLVSNLLDLPRNEPETWKIAADLLPHALRAVQQAHSGAADITQPEKAVQASGTQEIAQPTRALVAGAREYFEQSRAKFERTCFVIMPFGVKLLGDGRQVDFELIYHEIFRPAIQAVALDAVRVDQDYFVGATPLETYKYLEYSRLVLADITALSANVFYELGIRHHARQSGTVVVREAQGSAIPFDLASVRIFSYRCLGAEAVAESRLQLEEALAHALLDKDVDSPARYSLDEPSGSD